MANTDNTPAGIVERARRLRDNPDACMSALCTAFHAIRSWPGVIPWDPDAFYERATSGASEAERDCARFVLEVYNTVELDERDGAITIPDGARRSYTTDSLRRGHDRARQRPLGPFRVCQAWMRWDNEHRAAFLAWAKEPWTL